MRKLLFQNFLLRQYLQRQTIAIVFEFDPHFLIRDGKVAEFGTFDSLVGKEGGVLADIVQTAKDS